MSKLDKFMPEAPVEEAPQGMEFYASVQCTFCGENVAEQKYFPEDSVLAFKCSAGHRNLIEKFSIF